MTATINMSLAAMEDSIRDQMMDLRPDRRDLQAFRNAGQTAASPHGSAARP